MTYKHHFDLCSIFIEYFVENKLERMEGMEHLSIEHVDYQLKSIFISSTFKREPSTPFSLMAYTSHRWWKTKEMLFTTSFGNLTNFIESRVSFMNAAKQPATKIPFCSYCMHGVKFTNSHSFTLHHLGLGLFFSLSPTNGLSSFLPHLHCFPHSLPLFNKDNICTTA